jgi:hypothetical protein
MNIITSISKQYVAFSLCDFHLRNLYGHHVDIVDGKELKLKIGL